MKGQHYTEYAFVRMYLARTAWGKVDADGSFDVPFNPQWVKSNPEVLTTNPAGRKAKFGFNAVPVLAASAD